MITAVKLPLIFNENNCKDEKTMKTHSNSKNFDYEQFNARLWKDSTLIVRQKDWANQNYLFHCMKRLTFSTTWEKEVQYVLPLSVPYSESRSWPSRKWEAVLCNTAVASEACSFFSFDSTYSIPLQRELYPKWKQMKQTACWRSCLQPWERMWPPKQSLHVRNTELTLRTWVSECVCVFQDFACWQHSKSRQQQW